MATRRPAHNTPIRMDFFYGFLFKKAPSPCGSACCGLWAGLRVAMWITHVGGKVRHGLLKKSLTYCFHVLGKPSGANKAREEFHHNEFWGP